MFKVRQAFSWNMAEKVNEPYWEREWAESGLYSQAIPGGSSTRADTLWGTWSAASLELRLTSPQLHLHCAIDTCSTQKLFFLQRSLRFGQSLKLYFEFLAFWYRRRNHWRNLNDCSIISLTPTHRKKAGCFSIQGSQLCSHHSCPDWKTSKKGG